MEATNPDFDEEFAGENDRTEDYQKRKEKVFKPKQQAEKVEFDLKKELHAAQGERTKKMYSVYDDKVIIETMKEVEGKQGTIQSLLDQLTEKLIGRTFESVKERYRKWMKRFSEADREKILEFCKGKERNVLEGFMVKRKLDERKGICQLSEIVPFEHSSSSGAKPIQKSAGVKFATDAQISDEGSSGTLSDHFDEEEETPVKPKEDEETPRFGGSKIQPEQIDLLDMIQDQPAPVPASSKKENKKSATKSKGKHPSNSLAKAEDDPAADENGDFGMLGNLTEAEPEGRSVHVPTKYRETVEPAEQSHQKRIGHESPQMLGKRQPVSPFKLKSSNKKERPQIDTSDPAIQLLQQKANVFKRRLTQTDPESVQENSQILFKLLKQLCSYHERNLSEVIESLNEDEDLNMSNLRFKLCNHTTIQRLIAEDS